MGEIVVSADPTAELTAVGLGSCIGLAVVDHQAGVAGLAHIVLPESTGTGEPGRFADTAVPALLSRMCGAGAVTRRMEAAIAGGARMFEMSGTLDIGTRNQQAVRAALCDARVPVRASQTGGRRGRTLKVHVGLGLVTVRAAGEPAAPLLRARGRTELTGAQR